MLGRDFMTTICWDLGVRYMIGVTGVNETNDVTYVTCPHENIAAGAAIGYARASGRPRVVVLHVTPGAAHGILFKAYSSRIPVVMFCSQQHSDLILQEPVLTSGLAAAGPPIHEVVPRSPALPMSCRELPKRNRWGARRLDSRAAAIAARIFSVHPTRGHDPLRRGSHCSFWAAG